MISIVQAPARIFPLLCRFSVKLGCQAQRRLVDTVEADHPNVKTVKW